MKGGEHIISTKNNSEELVKDLQYALVDGTISYDSIEQLMLEMKRREKIQPYLDRIFQGSDGKWYVHLPDKKRTLRKRQTRDEIEKVLLEYVEQAEGSRTLGQVFELWVSNKLKYGEITNGSADRYRNDFKRFFISTGFAETKIEHLTEKKYKEFLKKQIAEKKLTSKTFSGLRIIARGILEYAQEEGLSTISPTQFFGDLHIGRNAFEKKVVDPKSQILSEDEIPILKKELIKTGTIWSLGVLLALQTGVRVGELSALKHSDWKGDRLRVCRTEVRMKNEQGKNCLVVREFTKTEAGMRSIFLTDSAKETLAKIVKINPYGEYLFENEKGVRIRGNTFNKNLTRTLDALGLPHRSIHKLRKTYGTTLIDNGCSDSVVTSQLGHKSIDTTRKYYYYSNKNEKEVENQIQKAINF